MTPLRSPRRLTSENQGEADVFRSTQDVLSVPEAETYFFGGIGKIMDTRRRY